MGISSQQYRVVTGSFAAKLRSPSIHPTSIPNGKVKIGNKGNSRLSHVCTFDSTVMLLYLITVIVNTMFMVAVPGIMIQSSQWMGGNLVDHAHLGHDSLFMVEAGRGTVLDVSSHASWQTVMELLRAGDVESNPGPGSSDQSNHGPNLADIPESAEDDLSGSDFEETREIIYFNPAHEIKTGDMFESIEKAKSDIKLYCDRTYFPLITASSWRGDPIKEERGRIRFKCTHGHKRESTAKSDRPWQRVNFTGCPCFININENKEGDWVVGKLCLKHSGHVISRENYHSYPFVRRLGKDDLDYVKEAMDLRAAPRNIAEGLTRRTGQGFKRKDAQNLIRKIKQTLPEDHGLRKHLSDIVTEGGDVQYSLDGDGFVDVLWVQTPSMRQEVAKNRPFLFQADTTFGTNREGYKLFTLAFKSLSTGKYAIHGLLFLSAEDHQKVRTGLSFFKEGLPYTERQNGGQFVFLVDKDFEYITILKELFDECNVLLCWVHFNRTIKEKVLPSAVKQSANQTFVQTTQEYKAEILDMILCLRDSNNEEEYNERKRELEVATSNVFVCPRPNKNHQLFSTYFDKNWHKEERRKMWVKHYRKHLNLSGSNNTNAVESMFRKIKHFEQVAFGKRTPTISELVPELKRILDLEQQWKDFDADNKRLVIFHPNPKYKDALESASWCLNRAGLAEFHRVILWLEKRRPFMKMMEENKVQEVYGKSNYVGLYDVDENTCNCTANRNYLICRHTLFFREQNHLLAFDESMFPAVYQKNSPETLPSEDDSEDEELGRTTRTPSPGLAHIQREENTRRNKAPNNVKFNRAFEASKCLPELMCLYDDDRFDKLELAVKNFVQLMRDGFPDDLLDYLSTPTRFAIHLADQDSNNYQYQYQHTANREEQGGNNIFDWSQQYEAHQQPGNYQYFPTQDSSQPQTQSQAPQFSYDQGQTAQTSHMQQDQSAQSGQAEQTYYHHTGQHYQWHGVEHADSQPGHTQQIPQHQAGQAEQPWPSPHYQPRPAEQAPQTNPHSFYEQQKNIDLEQRRQKISVAQFFRENSLREIPTAYRHYFPPNSIIKGVAGNGACFYTALAQELWGDASAWRRFRRLCHDYLLAWLQDHYLAFVNGLLPFQLMVGVGSTSYIENITTVEQYKQFLVSEASMLAWADPNWEMQNVCNIFGIDLKIFLYGRTSGPPESRQMIIPIYPNQNVLSLSNDSLPTKHTIYLYYREHTHYETIIAKPHNLPRVEKSTGLKRQRSQSESDLHLPVRNRQRSNSEPRGTLYFRSDITSKGRPRIQKRMGTPAQPGRWERKGYVNAQATMTEEEGLNMNVHEATSKKRGRGRPPGVKNKPKVPGGGVVSSRPYKQRGRPRGSLSKKSKRPLCSPLQEIADMFNSRRASSSESSNNSTITRSMSRRARQASEHEIPQEMCPTCKLLLDHQQSDRMCPDCLNGFLKCRTCMSELDGLEDETKCPKCGNLLHATCLKGDGCRRLGCEED